MGYSSRHDIVAAVEFLERRRPGKPIVVHGLSMGGAAAVFAAEELGGRVAGFILESPYQDLRIAVRNRTRNALPPVLDQVAYLGLLLVSPLILPDVERTSPIAAIAAVPIDVPILILAGAEDPVARPDEARAILERVQSHAQLVLFEHAGHMNFAETDPELYQRSVLEFVGHASKLSCNEKPPAATVSRRADRTAPSIALQSHRKEPYYGLLQDWASRAAHHRVVCISVELRTGSWQ
jgi:alpha-beta hydrolase superfamily lysophospholipase